MAKQPDRRPAPFRPSHPAARSSAAGPNKLRLLALSVGGLAVALVAAVGLIAALGDPSDATPKVVVSLREAAADSPAAPTPLSEVLVDPSLDAELMAEAQASDDPMLASLDSTADALSRAAAPLPKAPIAGFVQQGPMGPMPIIGPDGRRPFDVYRRPFAGDPAKPRIALVLGGLGFNARFTQQAIDELPPEITFSFMPYAKDLQMWIDRARADGHEVLLEIPMEPFDPEADDTGPQTLMAGSDPRENLSRFENLLSRSVGYFGVTNYQGGKFAASSAASTPIAKSLKERGIALVGSGIGPRAGLGAETLRAGAPFAAADRIIDLRRDAEAIDDQLLNLEALALERGDALGSGFAYPVTIEQVGLWAREVQSRGYILAPASSIVEKRSSNR